jgi:hypothetical protein
MKVFVFQPSNALIGKFDIQSFDDVAHELEKFAVSNRINPYDYLECTGRTWTIMTGPDGLELQEGRVQRADTQRAAVAGAPSGLAGTLMRRYADAYTEAHSIVTFGKVIKGIAVVLFIGFVIGGLMLASSPGGGGYGGQMNDTVAGMGFALACLIGIPTYVLGILVAAQGQTALATLDTAVNSSRHLTDDDVARVLSKRFSL